ncbi:hypothetical protein LCGC14_2409610, partial [marine sediment metagenome]
IGLGLSSEQIDNFLNSFVEIFGIDWYNSIPEDKRDKFLNRCFYFNSGPYSLTWIIRLGECILNLKDIEGFDNEIITRLRDKKQFNSVAIELDYSSCLKQAGMELELQPALGPLKVDGKVIINKKPIFFEIISQSSEDFKRKERNYGFQIWDFLKNKYSSRATYIRFKKQDTDPKEKIDKLYNILESKNPPFNYEDNEMEIHIAENDGGHTIEGSIMNREKYIRTWVKRVHKKYKQLPTNIGGIIIANSTSLWDPRDIDIVLNTSWRETKEGQKTRIAGIIYCTRQMLGVPSTSGERISFISPRVIINKFSKFNYTDELKAIANAISTFPNWM